MPFISKFFQLLSLVVLCASMLGSPVHAQAPDNDYIKPMPVLELLPEQEFIEKTDVEEETPPGYDGLKYKIRIPKVFKKTTGLLDENFTLVPKVFSQIGEYYGPARISGNRTRLTIEALELDYKLKAEQWMIQHLLASGTTIEGFRVHSENRAEALQVILRRGESYAVRSLVEMNGKNLVFVQYFLPVDIWDQEKALQEQVVGSFSLLNRNDEVLVEEMQEFEFLDIATMHYPSSWKLRAPPLRSVDVMEISVLNLPVEAQGILAKSSVVDGKIDIRLVSAYFAENLETAIEEYNQELKDNNLEFGEEIETEDEIIFHDLFEFARVHAYEAKDESGTLENYQLWSALLSANNYFYFVTLLTPDQTSNFEAWSRNTQTYKLLLEQFEPKSDSNSLE